VVEIATSQHAKPNPAWLSFVRTGRARSKIRHHLKTMEIKESRELGERLLLQSLRAEGIASLPETSGPTHGLWDKLLRFTGNKNRDELLADIGLGKRIATMVAIKLAALLGESGQKPDVLLMTQERYAGGHDQISQGVLALDGSEGASVRYATCCHPIPGDAIVGYLGRGEGLVVHTDDCPVIRKQLLRDSERFTEVEWSDEPVRSFETRLLVTLNNVKGALAKVAGALAAAEADITHLEMSKEPVLSDLDIRFTVAVRDRVHLAHVLRSLKRTPTVMRIVRERPDDDKATAH